MVTWHTPHRIMQFVGSAHARLAALCAAAAVALAVAALAPSAAAASGGFCSPPALGAPCSTGGTATLGNAEPGPGLAVGNPLHAASGNKYQLDIDLPANPSSPGLELVRHYNALSIEGGALGRNWTLSYDTRLLRRSDGWHARQADGSLLKIPAPLPGDSGPRWRWPDGRELHFDEHGRLVRIRSGNVTLLRIARHASPPALAGLIQRVEGRGGHVLHFHHGERGGEVLLEAVDTPLGRFRYDYETPDLASGHRTARLIAVARPDGMRRLYHYEAHFQAGNPYALTGISLTSRGRPAARLATWKYDRHGRVIEQQQHGRTLPTLRIQYRRTATGAQPGLTRVLGSDGRGYDVIFQRLGPGYRLVDRRAVECGAAGQSLGEADCPEEGAATGGDAQAGPAGSGPKPLASSVPTAQHDTAGRLAAVGGQRLRRAPDGSLIALLPSEPGWPGLALLRDGAAGHYRWRTDATGTTTVLTDEGRPAGLRHANGDMLRLHRDAQGRPVRIHETRGEAPPHGILTRLQWHGTYLTHIAHPAEAESRRYDTQGRLVYRSVRRPGTAGSPPARFQERFHHDEHGRLLRHELPEGGFLHYRWRDDGPRGTTLATLDWEDAQGRVHPVIDSTPGRPGYRHGNGLEMLALAPAGSHADTLRLGDGGSVLWEQRRFHDHAGRLLEDRHVFPGLGHHETLSYAHDARSRLQGASHRFPGDAQRWWYAWNGDGSLAAQDIDGQSRVPVVRVDASGLPRVSGPHALHYGPGRRLETVSLAGTGQVLARYRHNAFGHRITKQLADETIHFLTLHDRLVAEARSSASGGAPRVTRRYLHAGLAPVGMIDYPADGPARLYAVHADLSGAPRLLTDADRRLRWLASYTPTGQASRVAGDLRFPLRLPGQYEDEETGWHDNLLRTYAPELGQYLEPDPLGPLPGTDAYGYAAQQPWRYADPLGLLLFAFDGTRYSGDTEGNVWRLAQAYRDGAAHYHSGPGNSLFLDWDAVVAWRAGRILENQWQALLTAVERQAPGTVLPIDVIGFSRGAALARHFGNRIALHLRNGVFSVNDPLRGAISACVDLRFMGLFDTVAQFGVGGSHDHLYDFGIADMWSWVSHAVALHEHRWSFPLASADAGGAGNVVEAPFVGAHADIGGGLALRDPSAATPDTEILSGESDLADVALGWMHWQALAANVDFGALAPADTTMEAPWLRDMRTPFLRTIQRGDRAVAGPSGATRHPYQEDDPRLGRDARAQAETFIGRLPGWRSQAGDRVARVDMTGYARWLHDTLGWAPQ